jgi:bacillithiol biosynthesis cysteine-adding enzyme BshC
VLDYLKGSEFLKDLYTFAPNASGLAGAVVARKQYPVDREVLVQVLQDQYRQLPVEHKVEDAIALLAEENTFTICTAHQPNLATGYLYFVYKILHAIKLAQELKAAHPANNFVPVYYMGSEDADLDELGTFRYGDKKYVWDAAGQTGAVGRMKTESLEPLLTELFSRIGPPGEYAEGLEHLLREAYLKHDSVAQATQYLVHSLFGKYGLVVIDPDDARLKRGFVPVMEEDLLSHTAEHLVGNSIKALTEAGYKAQAHPRGINLFYLKDNLRERIEQDDCNWRVVNTDISWDKASLLKELQDHPERFSPNVMLRPLYQEMILPNVAFIGGGAEVAYWLQLQALFAHHNVFYPAILLRQSVMWVNTAQQVLMKKIGLDYEALFTSKDEAARSYISAQSGDAWKLPAEHDQLEVLLSSLREKAAATDPTLSRSADTTLTRMKHLLDGLEGKMLRALKRREGTALAQIERLQGQLFPGGGLAERVENFMPYYLEYGTAFLDELLQMMEPLRSEFLIVEADQQ